MNVDLIEKLTVGFDPARRAEVLEGLRNGFPLEVEREPPPRSWAPSFMNDVSRARITAHFEAETEAKRMLGPFTTKPSGRFWSKSVASPVSEVPKGDGKFRTIFNFSYDYENSVNGGIPAEAGHTTYPSFEEIAAELRAVGLDDVYLAMFDIENAFRNLKINSSDWVYQVVSWQRTANGPKEWYIDLALPFGIAVGPAVFNRFGSALDFIYQQECLTSAQRGVIGRLIRYLDDHLIMARGKDQTYALLDALLALMAELKLPVKDSKTIPATDALKFIGFWWEPRKDLVTLDSGRWAKLEAEMLRINDYLDHWEISVADIRSLSGVLCWAAKVIHFGMVYVRELYAVVAELGMSSASRQACRSRFFTEEHFIRRIRIDLFWWLDLCRDFRTKPGAVPGVRISQVGIPIATAVNPSLEIFSDMSGDGLGGYWRGTGMWAYAPIPSYITLDRMLRTEKDFISSGHGEAAGMLMCLLTFLPIWAARFPHRRPEERVLLHSDSGVAVSVWNTQRGRERMMPYLRVMERLCAFYNIILHIRFVKGVDNPVADMISRLQDSRMCAELRAIFPEVMMCARLRAVFPEGNQYPQPRLSPVLLFL